MIFFYILVNLLIIGLFLYSKFTPYQNRLTGIYLKNYNFFESIFNPLLYFIKKIAKPVQVGNGIAVDMSQIILLILLLLTLKFVL